VPGRYYSVFVSQSSLWSFNNFKILDLKVWVLFILILLDLLVILIVEIYKPVFKMLIRINVLKPKMFLNSKDNVNLMLVRKAVALR